MISKDTIISSFSREVLKSKYRVESVTDIEHCSKVEDPNFEFIFVDIKMFNFESNGGSPPYQTALHTLWLAFPKTKVIILTGHSANEAKQLLDAGVDGALNGLFSEQDLRELLFRSEKLKIKESRARFIESNFWDLNDTGKAKTLSRTMMGVFRKLKSVSNKNVNLILTGETGVGKNVLAKLIHQHSSRNEKPLVTVHCGGLAETLIESELFGHEKGSFTGAIRRKIGKFELAHQGTIFLDEIGTISPNMQIKLLQVLQEAVFQRVGGEEDIKVDVRVIAATNENLKELVDNGAFRKDLYYRLNVVSVHIPALKERTEDISWISTHFIDKYCRLHGKRFKSIDPDIFKALSEYSWPGNIRELENVIERACLLENEEELHLESFPREILRDHMSANGNGSIDSLAEGRCRVIEDFEKNYLEDLLERHNGKVQKVAESAKLGERQIHKLLSKYEIYSKTYR